MGQNEEAVAPVARADFSRRLDARSNPVAHPKRKDPSDTLRTCLGKRHFNCFRMEIHNSEVLRRAPLRHLCKVFEQT